RDAFDARDKTEEILDRSEKRIFDVTQKRITSQAVSIAECLKQTFDRINALRTGKGSVGGLPSGYVDLDESTLGFHKGELTIIAARPRRGKTTFALNLMRNMCMTGGHAGVFFSLEMPRIQVASNLLCSLAKVEPQALRGGYFTREEEERLIDAA